MAIWSNLHHEPNHPESLSRTPPSDAQSDKFNAAHQRMVERQLRNRNIDDPRVLIAMGKVARERFVSADLQGKAYVDHPLPIGLGQTVSQPYIVALMAQLAHLTPESRALDVGVGSGYQTAVLAELCQHVYGLEILPSLAEEARQRLSALGYRNVTIHCGDGHQGWPGPQRFDAILVSAASDHVPQALIEQLAPGGRLLLPLGSDVQHLALIEKRVDGSLDRQSIAPVQFVPMTGKAELTD